MQLQKSAASPELCEIDSTWQLPNPGVHIVWDLSYAMPKRKRQQGAKSTHKLLDAGHSISHAGALLYNYGAACKWGANIEAMKPGGAGAAARAGAGAIIARVQGPGSWGLQ